ncbi:acyltransferase [Kosakonia sp. BYX6]|uniref:Acyltransferase n=1 Tax=Kosakonia calanthes TaxID=3139408 RepID=A0ABZ3BA97_9ENTR
MNIRQLDMLRGIAALLVTLFHMKPFIEYISPGNSHFFNGGSYLGVSVFFILSGFVIGIATSRDTDFVSFLIKRVFRVYIPAVVATILYLLASGKDIKISSVLILFPDGGTAPYYGYGPFFITWTLVYELLFYVVFAFSMMFSPAKRLNVAAGIIIFNVTVLQFLINGSLTLTPGFSNSVNNSRSVVWSFLTNPINLLFIIGMFYFKYFECLKMVVSKVRKGTLAFYILIGSSLSFSGYFFMSGHGILQMGAFSTVLFGCFLLVHFMQDEEDSPSYIERALMWLGGISYSLYLCHYIAINLRVYYFEWLNLKNVHYHFVVILACVFVISIIFYYVVDKPVHIAGKKMASLIINYRAKKALISR